jgi:hypothetical protein
MGQLVNIDDFIKSAHIKSIKEDQQAKRIVVKILYRFINGEPITRVLKDMKISFSRFDALLSQFPKYLDIYEDAKIYNKKVMKNKIESWALEKAESGDGKMISFLLERLWPEEYGKKNDINLNINNNADMPPGWEEFVDAKIDNTDDSDE